jgi:hypothetical protein
MKNFIANSSTLLAVMFSAVMMYASCIVAKMKKQNEVSVVGLTTEELKFFKF